MKTITVTTNYTNSTTTLRLMDGRTATRRQYEAALCRCQAPTGDYLRLCRDSDNRAIVNVYDGQRVWAIIG